MITAPGVLAEPVARKALVLAPHYDDEVLGCGGLLNRWVAAGAEVAVLFLTDGTGGAETIEDRAAYAATRRAEAEKVAASLGLKVVGHLGLADGALAEQLEALAAAIAEALAAESPDALLVPSPLEASTDHRATFAALHEALAPVRPGHPLAGVMEALQILVYEVNHPLYPELLVDVSASLPSLARAMELYASQQRRHDYWSAASGLKRFRTQSLGPEIEAAEAYVSLRLGDFTTRSRAQLIRRLGGLPELLEITEGPRLSVVVRTCDRPQLLAEALASLAEGTYRRAEVVLVNDGGAPPVVPEAFPLEVTRVDLPDNRGRAAAAQAGIEAATGEWLCFLDDDDLAAPEHLATLAGLASAAGVRVAYTDAAVGIYALGDGGGWTCVERRLPYSRDFDPDLLRLDNYIPFNTLVLERALVLEVGGFDLELPFFEDWELLIRLATKTRFHHLSRVTCEYRHFRSGGHHVFGESPRARADFVEVKARVLAKHGTPADFESLARAVDGMRAEAVEQAEAAASRGRDLAELRREQAVRDEAFHRLNGRLAALEGDFERQAEQLRHHAGEEAALREVATDQERRLGETHAEISRLEAAVREQGDHLGRTYAEIERLNTLIRTMEETRAWRLHQWLQRTRRPD